jgi:hypothetical protein
VNYAKMFSTLQNKFVIISMFQCLDFTFYYAPFIYIIIFIIVGMFCKYHFIIKSICWKLIDVDDNLQVYIREKRNN